jgi:hypothetical protein
MDLYCTRCGEPSDNDSIHVRAEELGSTYKEVLATFQAEGCGKALGWSCEPATDETRRDRASVATVLYELLGDDVDGAMCEMDDAISMGFL